MLFDTIMVFALGFLIQQGFFHYGIMLLFIPNFGILKLMHAIYLEKVNIKVVKN